MAHPHRTFTGLGVTEWILRSLFLFAEEIILPNDWFFLIYLREGNEPEETTQITYHELLVQVCQFSNVLRKQGEWEGGGKGLEGLALGFLRTWGK